MIALIKIKTYNNSYMAEWDSQDNMGLEEFIIQECYDYTDNKVTAHVRVDLIEIDYNEREYGRMRYVADLNFRYAEGNLKQI